MLAFLRACAVLAVLTVALPASSAGEKDLSELTQVSMKAAKDDVVVMLSGSKAPDFTSFTMTDPFRVVIDWAGSRLQGVTEEKRFERGLIRRITTKQYDSEAEKISRVTVELSRETSYHVEADGKRVMVHFVPVPDPIKEKDAEPVHKGEDKPKERAEEPTLAAVEGPLTEPAVAVPENLPPIPARHEPPKTEIAEVKPAQKPVEPQPQAAPAIARVAPALEKQEPAPRATPPKKPSPMLADARDMKPLIVGKPAIQAPPPKVAEAAPKLEPKSAETSQKSAEAKTAVAAAARVETKAEAFGPPKPSPAELLARNDAKAASEPSVARASAKATPDAASPALAAKSEPKADASKPVADHPPAKTEPPPAKAPATTAIAARTETKPSDAKAAPAKEATPPLALASTKGAAKTEPKIADTKTPSAKPGPAAEEKREIKLASLPSMSADKKPMLAQEKSEQAPSLRAPPVAKPDRSLSNAPQRFASNLPQRGALEPNRWTVPSIPVKDAPAAQRGASGPNHLPVVRWKVAQNDGKLKPTATLPADPDDEPSGKGSKSETPPINGTESGSAGKAAGGGGSAGSSDFDPGPRVMKYIGFQQMADVSRVFVRCDGKAKFKESQNGSTMVLELYNTRINVKNNERPLDTTYFNTAVTKVQAVKAGDNTRIEVKLRESVPYKVTRIGTTIAIDFKRAG
jgi:colicin import membrane protein